MSVIVLRAIADKEVYGYNTDTNEGYFSETVFETFSFYNRVIIVENSDYNQCLKDIFLIPNTHLSGVRK